MYSDRWYLQTYPIFITPGSTLSCACVCEYQISTFKIGCPDIGKFVCSQSRGFKQIVLCPIRMRAVATEHISVTKLALRGQLEYSFAPAHDSDRVRSLLTYISSDIMVSHVHAFVRVRPLLPREFVHSTSEAVSVHEVNGVADSWPSLLRDQSRQFSALCRTIKSGRIRTTSF